ncbi:MAG: enoyl-CoA hydratase-related protein [Rhodothermales bacterium]
MSDFETLLYAVDADGIATITINRPDKLNALSHQVMDDLDAVFGRARTDEAVKGVILTGSGPKSFVAGADIKQFVGLGALEGHRFAVRGQAIFGRIESMAKPVVAAVNGYALGGGCELAIACHMRVASENAIFGQPEVKLGIIPGYGGTQRLPRLVGHGLATELVLTGEHISAQRAHEIGLVNHVVPAEDLLAKAKALLMSIVTKAPLAVAMSLEALQAASLPLSEGLKYEAALFGQACGTEDFAEGAAAFLERRRAEFKGR